MYSTWSNFNLLQNFRTTWHTTRNQTSERRKPEAKRGNRNA